MTTQDSKPAPYFAETTTGALVLLAIQFVSLPILVIGLTLVSIAELVSRFRAAKIK